MHNLYARIIQYFLVHFLSEYKNTVLNGMSDSVKQNYTDDKALCSSSSATLAWLTGNVEHFT